MNVKFLNPFVEAASEVLQAECNIKVTRGNLTLHKSALTTDDVTVQSCGAGSRCCSLQPVGIHKHFLGVTCDGASIFGI